MKGSEEKMIKIPAYNDHILARYMYLMALVLPFPPESILGNDVFYLDGKEIKSQNFLQKSSKRPRRRDNEYIALLNKLIHCSDANSNEEKFEEDQLLAAKIINLYSHKLYNFLYKDKFEEGKIPQIHQSNLRKLLFAKMDDICPELEAVKDDTQGSYKMLTKYVFRYDAFSQNKHAAILASEMNVQVCPYCNRQYTSTVIGKDRLIRSEFDHYKSQSRYPYFAVSLFNLIPSCAFCNKVKSDKDYEVLYPYSDEMGTDVVFHTKEKSGFRYLLGESDAVDEFEIELVQINSSLLPEKKEKIDKSNEVFCLTELYNTHKNYVLHLFKNRYIYNEKYLKFLYSQFHEIFQNIDDVKRMAYHTDIDPTQWGKQPLSKLTHDIVYEIENLVVDIDNDENK